MPVGHSHMNEPELKMPRTAFNATLGRRSGRSEVTGIDIQCLWGRVGAQQGFDEARPMGQKLHHFVE